MNEKEFKAKIYLYGDIIRKKRLSKNMTEKRLAEVCDISDRALRYIEAGHVVPKLDTTLRIADALDIDVGKLRTLMDERQISYSF